MECQAQDIANVILVQIIGRIDHTTANALEHALLPLLNGCSAEGKKALLDLSGVGYMSSAGLRVLTIAAKECRKRNADIAVAALQPLVQEVFKIARLEIIFQVFKTVQEALEMISPAAAAAYGRPA
jgi:anti-sigma B factor antagonist/stage II sporulation protein AA (anti-sigma F factor antagonist)